MRTETARHEESILPAPVLHLAFELGETTWKLGFTTGLAQRPRLRQIPAGDLETLQEEIGRAKMRFGVAPDTRVVSCYEAGRDGFWLHRFLLSKGIENLVVDSASIEVKRRRRHVKTDRLDVGKLLEMLVRHFTGERRVWSLVRVPTPEQEDRRQLHRELEMLKRERTRLINRIKGLLASVGVRLDLTGDFPAQLERVRLWNGSTLLAGLKARLVREWERLQSVRVSARALEKQRHEQLHHGDDPALEQVRQLQSLKGIGETSAWIFVMEFFAWRKFTNRRQVGALAGLTPTPYQSGDSRREQGASKAGNRHIRHMAVEIAWSWLRYQPESELARWYERRFGHGSKRMRKIGIVALARKLLIELWHYLETGALPSGAELKA